jgi:hypothetical protein
LIEKKVTVKKSQVDNGVPHDEALRTQSSRPPARLLGCLVHHAPYRCSLAIARSVRDEHALSLLVLPPLMSANISPAVKDLQINRVEGGKQRRLDEGKQQSIDGMPSLGIMLPGERGADLAQTGLRFIDLYVVG